ncbi:hypothetical protein PsorP6_012594 [Peronosclerospora sorghi]|uniref:Uncharacterized protein n=1 Tax=Peronosclerospora sorghi TaxID=230839 RepID=A0ACC0WIJ2_9STRA|nr:hypothetical protein PsorP6_012594 [Peronosclerospora sorghi]
MLAVEKIAGIAMALKNWIVSTTDVATLAAVTNCSHPFVPSCYLRSDCPLPQNIDISPYRLVVKLESSVNDHKYSK